MQESMIRTARKKLDAVTDGIEVHIERHCWTKMHGWCKAAHSEVSGLGMAVLEGGKFKVYDVFLVKQKCSSGYTELDDESVGRLNYKLIKAKKPAHHLRFWWHTHYNFNTFWSGTDDDNAQRLMQTNGEWELSLVINQRGDWLCRMDMMSPFNITIDELPVFIIPNHRKGMAVRRNFKADIKKWVKPMTYEPTVYVAPHIQTGITREGSEFNMGGWWDRYAENYPDVEESYIPNPAIVQERIEEQRSLSHTGSMQKQSDGAILIGSRYAWYLGRLMTIEKYRALKDCPCEHKSKDFSDCACPPTCDYCLDLLCKMPSEVATR